MSARDDLLSALSWPMTLERESVPEATRSLRPAADMLDAFGWVAHPVRHGWIRWAAISRDGDAAIAEARAESLLIVRHPGTPPAAISDRAHLFAADSARTRRLRRDAICIGSHRDLGATRG